MYINVIIVPQIDGVIIVITFNINEKITTPTDDSTNE